VRRLLDVAILLTAIGVILVWWRTFEVKAPPAPVAEPAPLTAGNPPAPIPNPPAPSAERLQRMEEEALRRARWIEENERLEQEWQAELERDRLAIEEAYRRSRPSKEELEQMRRDRERAELWAKHGANQRQRFLDSERQAERVREAKASYEALKQARNDCARVTGNGSITAYGCEGINKRVRQAELDVKRANNGR
jgi:hypothetical protein